MWSYAEKRDYIIELVKSYNTDHHKQHLKEAREFAEAQKLPLELIMDKHADRIAAIQLRATQYYIKDEGAACKLRKTPSMCGTTADGCRRCGWWAATEAERIRQIRAGKLTGNPAHLKIKRERRRSEK